jgi:hypothetical protein
MGKKGECPECQVASGSQDRDETETAVRKSGA